MNTKIKISLLFLSVCFIWGTTWLAMEIAVETIPPITATGLRFALASPPLLLISKIMKIDLLFPKEKWLEFVLISLFYFAVPFTLMIFGEQFISSGLAAIIFGTMPVAVLLLSMLLFRQRVPLHQLMGLVIALVSLSAIIAREMGIDSNGNWVGILAMVAAVIMHALIYTTVQKRCKGIHVLTYNTLPCLAASVFLLMTGVILETPDLQSFSLISLSAVAYLGMIAGIGEIMAYFQLNKLASPFQASICFLIFPVVALTLDSLINGGSISHDSMLITGILIMGILLTKIPEQALRFTLRLPGSAKT